MDLYDFLNKKKKKFRFQFVLLFLAFVSFAIFLVVVVVFVFGNQIINGSSIVLSFDRESQNGKINRLYA